MALPTIKNTNTKSFTDLQISRQTNSSGILSDQNLSGGASGNRLQNQTENHYEVIDDIIRRNVIHQDDSSDSGTYLSFTEEVRLRNGYPELITNIQYIKYKIHCTFSIFFSRMVQLSRFSDWFFDFSEFLKEPNLR